MLVLANRQAFSPVEALSFPRLVKTHRVHIFERTQLVRRLFGEGIIAATIRKAMIVLDPLFLCLNVINICRFLASSRPNLLISCNGGYPGSEASLAAVIAADILRVPSILVIMSEPRRRRGCIRLYELALDRLALSRHRQIVVNSKKQRASLVDRREAQSDNIHIVYNGISDVECKPRANLEHVHAQFTVGVVCRLDQQKGVDDLIKAFASIAKVHDLRLSIIGEGSYQPTLNHLSRQLNVSDRVSFLGFMQGVDLENAYRSLDLYVLPSHWEGLPYGILEAMRAGLPIIATDVGGVSEAIRHEVEGLLVPPQSPDLIKDAILRIYTNPDEAARFARAARNRFLNLFTKDIMSDSFIRLF